MPTLKYDGEINGRRIRVYATRSEYLAVADETDVNDPEAEVMVYPHIGEAEPWAHQAALDL